MWVLQSNYGTFSREIVSRPKVQTAVIRQSADGDNAHQGAAESSSYYEHVLLPADTLQSLALTYNTTV